MIVEESNDSDTTNSETESISQSNRTDYNSDISSKNNKSINNSNKNEEEEINTPSKHEISIKNTLITTIIDNFSTELALSIDITQKIIIFYGIAARLYDIHKRNLVKVNVIPDYLFLDENLFPYVDIEKLNNDSKKTNPDDFLVQNSKNKIYFPPEIKNEKLLISDNYLLREKVDSYVYGALLLSIITNTKLTEDMDYFDFLDTNRDKGQIPQELSNLIDICLSEDPRLRPLFCDILYIIDRYNFLKSLEEKENFDINAFKKFQRNVVDEEFIQPIEPNFDFSKIPGARLFQESDFTNLVWVASGGCGDVYLATPKNDTAIQVAYKIVKRSLGDENQNRIRREIQILATVDHYSVQNLYGYIEGKIKQNVKTVILTVYQENGNLASFTSFKLKKKLKKINMQNQKKVVFDFTQKFIVLYGIAAGMHYLHSKSIAHRDLKPQNILMNENLEPLISDFGLSKNNVSNCQSIHLTGSVYYMSPERLDANYKSSFSIFDAKLDDVYAFSILAYELFTGLEPWKNPYEAQNKVPDGIRPIIPDDMPKLIRLLIEACWQQEPEMRPSFEMILKMMSDPIFIENLGVEIDMERFHEYQRKVVPESFISYNSEKDKKVSFQRINFSEIPEEKVFLQDEFEEVSSKERMKRSFFVFQKVKKNSNVYYQIDLKDEYFNDKDILLRFKKEIHLMQSIDHPAFNPLYGLICFPPKYTYKEDAKSIYEIFTKSNIRPPSIITTFSPKINLLHNQKNLSITQKFIIIYGIAAGMYHLHKKGMAHLNLKPENISLNQFFEPLINIDITSRPKYERDNLIYFLPAFSFAYVAPELMSFHDKLKLTFDEKRADVYSFAMIVYYLISGIHPWDMSRGFFPILKRTLNGERPVLEGIIQAPFDQLISECWSTDPTKRLTFKKILNLIGSEKFVRSIDILDLEKFKEYRKKVVPEEFIFPIDFCSIRHRDEFEFDKFIGSGTFGNLSLYIDKTNGKRVAYKEIPSDYSNFISKQKEYLSSLNFPSIISLYGFIEPDEEKKESVILTPFVKGNLESVLLHEKAAVWYNYTQKCIILYGIAMGMYKLHSHNITHQDLKPQNILINDSFEPLITDFAISKFVNPNQTFLQSLSASSEIYISPEAFFSKQEESQNDYDEKLSDVYSYGLLMYFIMTGIQPFENTGNMTELMKRIASGERPKIPDSVDKKMKDLISSCWSSDPSSRPSFYEIVKLMSDASFFGLNNGKFNTEKFISYQIKFGEPEFVNFDTDIAQKFQQSDSFSSSSESSLSSSIIPPEFILSTLSDQQNLADSQYRLGCMYRDGIRVEKDMTKAASYFRKAADQGHLDGIIAYAICLKKGAGVSSNSSEAFKLIQTAIDRGSTDAMVILARWSLFCYPRKYKKCIELLQKAIEAGHPDAPAILGSLLERKSKKDSASLNTDLNLNDIIGLYQKSCFLGSYEGMFQMARHYQHGVGVKENKYEALRLYILAMKAASFNRVQSFAVYCLAKLYEDLDDAKSSFKLADFYLQKDKFVGYLLCSDLYRRGVGVEENIELADLYYQKSKGKRFINEQLKFSMFFNNTNSDSKFNSDFFEWTKIAAENGSPTAQANLCRIYTSHHLSENSKTAPVAATTSAQQLEASVLPRKTSTSLLDDSALPLQPSASLPSNLSSPSLVLAELWGKKSADAKSNLGLWNLARLYKVAGEREKEAECLMKLADTGCKKALVRIGMCYRGCKRGEEALEMFKRAANLDCRSGLFRYGEELLRGELGKKKVEEGLAMIRRAADRGCRGAIKRIVDVYSTGKEGVQVDRELADRYKQMLKNE